MTGASGRARRLRFPHPLTLLTVAVLAAAALSYVLPAGEYERRDDAGGRSVVVPGSYEEVEPNPVGLFDAVVAIPRGMASRADVVFLIFLIGGAFAVFDATGALRRGIAWLTARLQGREILAIPIVSLAFAAGGASQNLQEEIIPLVPALMLLTRRLGYTPMVGVAISAGSAFLGSSFSPINPFQVLTAQEVAGVTPLSGSGFRLIFMAIALAGWIGWTMRYAARTRVPPDTTDPKSPATSTASAPASPAPAPASALAAAAETPRTAADHAAPDAAGGDMTRRDFAIFGIVGATFGVLVWGLLQLDWDFDHISALFFIMGVVVGITGRLGITGTAEAYARGFRDMGYAALLIGFANSIAVVLSDARIIDTIVRGLFIPLADLPLALSAIGMAGAQGVLHVAVPSVSGQAVLTLPVLVPLSDLLGISRQVTVLAYQYGAGLCELITPTNGALMAILAASGVRYDAWLRFVIPRYLALMALAAAALFIALATGYS